MAANPARRSNTVVPEAAEQLKQPLVYCLASPRGNRLIYLAQIVPEPGHNEKSRLPSSKEGTNRYSSFFMSLVRCLNGASKLS